MNPPDLTRPRPTPADSQSLNFLQAIHSIDRTTHEPPPDLTRPRPTQADSCPPLQGEGAAGPLYGVGTANTPRARTPTDSLANPTNHQPPAAKRPEVQLPLPAGEVCGPPPIQGRAHQNMPKYIPYHNARVVGVGVRALKSPRGVGVRGVERVRGSERYVNR